MYYTTVFASDWINNPNNHIPLASLDPIIDQADIARGYVLKDELLKYYSEKIQEKDITPNSRIVELCTTSYDGLQSGVSRCLPISE